MIDWRIKLDKFINKWKDKSSVSGMLLYSDDDDIVIHIVLDPRENQKEIGRTNIDGLLIKYFVGTTLTIRNYFDSYQTETKTTMREHFLSGQILIDKNKEVMKLKEEASKRVK